MEPSRLPLQMDKGCEVSEVLLTLPVPWGESPCQEEEEGPHELPLPETPKGQCNALIFTKVQEVAPGSGPRRLP